MAAAPGPSLAITHALLRPLVTATGVTIFSKTTCPWCAKAKKLFQDINVVFTSHELDTWQNGPAVQEALYEDTKQKTVPNIFINGQHVGGYSDLHSLKQCGVLEEVIRSGKVDYDFDLVVVGGGSGGLAAAKAAASLGKKIALCDFVKPSPLGTTWGLGGTCVNVGCIPKKLFHRAALIKQDIKDGPSFGWEIPEPSNHNWDNLVSNIQRYIKSLNFGYRSQLLKNKINYFNSFASFIDNHTLQLVDKKQSHKRITSKSFLIAVGGRPSYPDVPGAVECCITSDDIFSLKSPPGKTLIVGASYIALETAGFLCGLGYDTTVMVRSILLRGFDQDMANMIGTNLESYGVKFMKKVVPKQFIKDGSRVKVVAVGDDGKEINETFDTVVLAIGRNPCTSELNLSGIGVLLNPRNSKIIVNEKEQTNVPNVFAVGDVIDGKPELTPVAIKAGQLLAQRLFSLKSELMDYGCVATTVFTPLEYGCIGLSEDEAMKRFEGRVEVYHNEFTPLESVLSCRFDSKCYAKIVCIKNEDKSERVVGFHVLGPNAGEITQGFALPIKMGATKAQFDSVVGIHPTNAEVFTTLSITKSSGAQLGGGGC